MYPEKLLFLTPVELESMLDAREHRLEVQTNLQKSYETTLISFTLNMVGASKVFPLSVKTYEYGKGQIAQRLKVWGVPVLSITEIKEHTGYECFFAVKGEAKQVKKALTPLEENSTIGRLFDIDVLDLDGNKISREEIGYGPRACLLCEEPAFVCGRSRRHSVEELWNFEVQLMWDFFAEDYATATARLAVQSLLFEVSVTPKPGLVDQNNNGSHRDMNLRLFEKSAFSLQDYFKQFAEKGIESALKTSTETDESQHLTQLFKQLRPLGMEAECAMMAETKGVNTHKGVIFSMGLFLGALGYLYGLGEDYSSARLQEVIQKMSHTLEEDFSKISPTATPSHGEKLYLKHGIRGIRGEAVQGYPALFDVALPQWEKGVARGYSANENGVVTLLTLIGNIEDSNIIHRSSYEKMLEIQSQLQEILCETKETSISALLKLAEDLDRAWIAENISAGGSADMLALTYFLYLYQSEWGEGYGF